MNRTHTRRQQDVLAGALSLPDHDLLIEIRTKLDGLGTTVANNNTRTEALCAQLSTDKASTKDLASFQSEHAQWRTANDKRIADQDDRIRRVENLLARGLGALTILQAGSVLWIAYHH